MIIILKKLSANFKQIVIQTKRSVRGNWGFPFIAGFILLLIVSAIQLAGRWVSVAEPIATCAYFTLVIGVVLQLVCLTKYKLKNGAAFNETS